MKPYTFHVTSACYLNFYLRTGHVGLRVKLGLHFANCSTTHFLLHLLICNTKVLNKRADKSHSYQAKGGRMFKRCNIYCLKYYQSRENTYQYVQIRFSINSSTKNGFLSAFKIIMYNKFLTIYCSVFRRNHFDTCKFWIVT